MLEVPSGSSDNNASDNNHDNCNNNSPNMTSSGEDNHLTRPNIILKDEDNNEEYNLFNDKHYEQNRNFKEKTKCCNFKKYCCRIAIILPTVLISIALFTFLSIFLINVMTTFVLGKDFNTRLIEEEHKNVRENLAFYTSIASKLNSFIQELYSTNYPNILITRDSNLHYLSKMKIIFPEVSLVSLSNTGGNEVFFERLPNGTILQGFKDSNDTNLRIYLAKSIDVLENIKEGVPIIVTRNYTTTYLRLNQYLRQDEFVDFWTPFEQPYFHNNEYIISRCSLVYRSLFNNSYNDQFEKEDIIGMVSSGYSISDLNKLLKTVKVGKTGFALVTERSGDIIASSLTSNNLIKTREHVLNSSKIARLVGTFLDKNNTFKEIQTTKLSRVFIGTKRYIVYVSPFKDNNLDWLVFIIFPHLEYLSIIDRGYIIVVTIAVFMIITSFILTLTLGCFITIPLRKLQKELQLVKDLNLEQILQKINNGHNFYKNNFFLFELTSIQQTFYSMVYALQSFRKYVPEYIIKRSLRKKQVAEMFLNERKICILFLDFVGFTELTEKLTPIQLVELVGEALEEMTLIIEEQGGIIDKYIDSNSEHACHATLKCINKLQIESNTNWNKRKLPTLQCRIGLHCGKVLLGNFGSTKRLNYTALGKNVNLAASIEPLCKLYGLNNLINIVIVKGSSKAIEVYELLKERKEEQTENDKLLIEIEMITLLLRDALLENNLKECLNCIDIAMKMKGFEKDKSLLFVKNRSINHAFMFFAYLTPLIGGFLADALIGKYWTIVGLGSIYCVGQIIVSITAIDKLTGDLPHWWGAIIGLILVALRWY
ncbi:hypothetical protein ABK040_000143 [Willaertia magna]